MEYSEVLLISLFLKLLVPTGEMDYTAEATTVSFSQSKYCAPGLLPA